MKERFQKAVDEVLADFDFNKVYKTMVTLNWTWYDPESDVPLVPSLERVKARGKELLQEAAEKAAETKSEFIIGTGGFRAEAKYYRKTENEKSFLWVRLAFILEEWDNCE